MDYALTLVAPEKGGLSEKILQDLSGALGWPETGWRWLSPEKAAEIFVDRMDARRGVRAWLRRKRLEIDVFVLHVENRRKKLLLADMDSTIVVGETLDELAAYAGLKEKIAAITERAMKGELDFQAALRERVRMLKGLSASALEETMQGLKLMPGAKALVQTMKAHGSRAALVSGGFSYFTKAVAGRVGFDMDYSNILEIQDNLLTGLVREPIYDKDGKLQVLRNLMNEMCLNDAHTLTVGDGANDLPMLLASGFGVAYHAKPLVNRKARHHIRYGDLTALLYAQGYCDDEFLSAG